MNAKKNDVRVRIARRALEMFLANGTVLRFSDLVSLCAAPRNPAVSGESAPGEIPKNETNDAQVLKTLLDERAGVFVSLKKNGDLRGCIGTIQPKASCVAEEIIQNAISAATQDPRFECVDAAELPLLIVSVDVLGPNQPIVSRDELDPAVWGVIVTHGLRRGLLLPDLEGVDTVDAQLAIACRKAGIDPSFPYKIEKFLVKRYF